MLRIHRFLAEGGRTRSRVPIKERSAELFGQEKRLDTLKDGALFLPGRLTLEALRCFVVAPPLVWEPLPASTALRPLLVLENHGTFHSFARWNRAAAAYAAVIYGAGDAFKTLAPSLAFTLGAMAWDGRTLYFGDLDAEGLTIPLVARHSFRAAGLSDPIAHVGCYQQLLLRAADVELPRAAEPMELPPDVPAWLGDELAAKVGTWFMRGTRIPQELVGWEVLLNDGATFAH